MPSPMPASQEPQLTTKTKTRTKAVVATLAIVIGLGIIAAVGAIRLRRDMVCNRGSRAGVACKAHRDCQVTEGDRSARCVRGLPDFTIEEVLFDPSTMSFRFSTYNRGTVPTPSINTAYTSNLAISARWLSADRTEIPPEMNYATLSSLEPNEFEGSLGRVPPTEARYLRIVVDPNSLVVESNERNNVWEGEIPPRLPDLVVESVTFDPITRMPSVTIKNQGSVAVSWTTAIPPQGAINFYDTDVEAIMSFPPPLPLRLRGSDGSDTGYGLGFAIRALAPGETFTATWMLGIAGAPSSIPVEAIAARVQLDSDNRVLESNETNNRWIGLMPSIAP